MRRKLESKHYYFVLGVIILYVLLQSLFLLAKISYSLDEGHSILLAVGKFSNYFDILKYRKYPYGELVDIQEYKDLFKIDKKFCFGKIKKDATLDIHPPLYFWLLHIWIIMTGGAAYIWTGALFNLFLCMFIILLLFKFAFELFNSFEDAIFSILLFCLSPTIYNADLTRPYFLLTLIVLLAGYLLFKIIKKDKVINFVNLFLFSILICLGFLCHYNFIFICIAWFIFLSIHYWKNNKALIMFYIASCLLGFLLFCNIYPGFIKNFSYYSDVYLRSNNTQTAFLDMRVFETILYRLTSIFSAHQESLAKFLLNSGQIFYYLFISAIAIFFLGIWFSIKKDKISGFIFASLFYPLFFISIFFLSKKYVPWSALYEKYTLFILPFFFLNIVFFINKKSVNFKRIVLVCLCQILIFSTVDNLIIKNINNKDILIKREAFLSYLEDMRKDSKNDINYAVLDNSFLLDEGINKIFKVIHYLPEKTKIIIADASFLFSNYSTYFGDESVLFPCAYITYNIWQKNTPSNILVVKFIKDSNIKLTINPLFNNLTDYDDIFLKVNRKNKE